MSTKRSNDRAVRRGSGCPHDRASRRRSGLTLVEIMISMVILSFGLLGVAALQVRAITESSSGENLSEASAIARDRLEELSRLAWDAAALNDTAGAWTVAAPQNSVRQDETNTNARLVYTRQERVAWDAPLPADVELKNIEVRVTWSDGKRQNRQVLLSSARLRETDE